MMKLQVWTDVEQNIKVQFTYQSQNPVLDQPNQLKFIVQNLKTGGLVTHNSSGQFINFRFANITVLLTMISAPDIAVLAPFRLIVP
jgi:hypothetical protein